MDILVEKDRKARKEHICSLCCDTIKVGETYRYTKIAENGKIYEWKEHLECFQIIKNLDELGYISMLDEYNHCDFWQGCYDYCHEYVCINCKQFNKNANACIDGEDFCVHKVYEESNKHVKWRKHLFKADVIY